jgi:hypothetical protein
VRRRRRSKAPAEVRTQVLASRAQDGTTPAKPKVVRRADVQPTQRPSREYPLQEGDVVTGRPTVQKDGSVTMMFGMVMGQVDSNAVRARETVTWFDILWSDSRRTMERPTRLRRVESDPDL